MPLKSTLKELCGFLSPFNSDPLSINHENLVEMVTLAKSHRISAILAEKLNERNISLPEKASELLSSQVRNTSFKMMGLSRELINIENVFAHQGIEAIQLKGPVQSLQIYGGVSFKNSRDLDILIDSSNIEKSISALFKIGYKTTCPYQGFNSKQKDFFVKSQNQIVFFHPEKKVQVELHWRLFANRNLLDLDFSGLYENSEKIKLGGTAVYGLNKASMILYLIAHGAKHQWSILYWLLEICYLIHNKSIDIEKVYSDARRLGIDRPFLQFTGLAHTLFNMKIDDQLEKQLSKKVIQQLISDALNSIGSQNKSPVEKSVINYTNALTYKVKLRKDLAYKFGTFNLISINDFQVVNLPSSLFFLYYPLRPFIWCKRYLIK